MTISLDEGVEYPGENGRRAVIEEDLQAACRSSKATARLTELCGTM
jgi:hypothetical protein